MNKNLRNYIVTCFLLYVNIVAANKSKTLIDNHQKVTITCLETQDCIKHLGEGYNCENLSCECEHEELCGNKVNAPKISAIVNVIDEQCTNDDICKIKDANCQDGHCRCVPGKVASANKRKCLPISRGLDEECDEDIQCISKEPNSVCRNKKCVCNDIHNQDKFSCVLKVGLDGKCNSNAECSHIRLSRCGTIYCECEYGFIPSEDKSACLPIAKKKDDVCEESVQCRQLYGKGAVCRRNECECDAVHTLVNNSSCPSKLKKFCDVDEDCKMYRDDPSMQCLRDRCECSPLYIEIDGACNGGTTITYYSTLLYIIFLVNQFL